MLFSLAARGWDWSDTGVSMYSHSDTEPQMFKIRPARFRLSWQAYTSAAACTSSDTALIELNVMTLSVLQWDALTYSLWSPISAWVKTLPIYWLWGSRIRPLLHLLENSDGVHDAYSLLPFISSVKGDQFIHHIPSQLFFPHGGVPIKNRQKFFPTPGHR